MSQPDPHLEPKRPRWTAGSMALFVIGLLILIPSGLCTALLGGWMVLTSLSTVGISPVFTVLIFGGIPMALGASLVYAGLNSRRRS
jgi:hypothetical protein